jgi:hypothetical protein
MKLLNFQIKGTELEIAERKFDLHNHFTLQGYTYDTINKIFELNFKGIVTYCNPELELDNSLTTELKIIFRQVIFLRIQDCPFDEKNVCFDGMEFVSDLTKDTPEIVRQIQELFYTDEIESFNWKNYIYISFIHGVDILISAETVEVRFHQSNS